MSLLLALAMAVAPHKPVRAPAPAAHQREVAMKSAMANWRGEWRIEPEGVACKTAKGTGDARLDTIGCRAIQVCYAPRLPEVAAIEDGAGTADEKKARVRALLDAGKPCIARNQAMAIEVLAGTRAAPKPVRETGR